MKTTDLFLLFFVFLFISCEKNEIISDKELTDGFCIVIKNKVVINHHEVDYYDFSEHKIYLKNNNSFLDDTIRNESFTVYCNMDSIYSGHISSYFSSFITPGPVIYTDSFLRENKTIPIGCIFITDEKGNVNIDPRGDVLIIEALKKYNQFRE
jgi:hypothetical protein